MIYQCLRRLLFILPPEAAHAVTFRILHILRCLRLLKRPAWADQGEPIECMGLSFANRAGLAAGLDKDGDHIDELSALGFGFIEVGTVTPQPQSGNPKPRLFRLVKQEALINRMGFNNKGVDYLLSRLKRTKYRGVLGINIGKNKVTENKDAINDYLICMKKVYPYANYIVVNLSSPNTPGLRELQEKDALEALLSRLKEEQNTLKDQYGKYVPLVLKVAPDLTTEQMADIAKILSTLSMDGLTVSNTTSSREGVADSRFAGEAGGLSGLPLYEKSLEVLKQFRVLLGDNFPIIAVGGIMSAEQGQAKRVAGADLLQIYTGLIYQGPSLIKRLVRKE